MKRSNQKGFALMFAIIAILIISGSAVFLVQNTSLFQKETDADRAHKKNLKVAVASAEMIRRATQQALQQLLQSAPDCGGGKYCKINEIQKITRAYVPQSTEPDLQEVYESTCLFQGSADTPGNHECTTNRLIMPKVFQAVVKVIDRNNQTVSVVTDTYEAAPATLNKFSYLVTNAQKDFNIGDFTAKGNMGIFFKDPTKQKIRFKPPGPATFEGLVLTNAKDQGVFMQSPGAADPEFKKGVAFSSPATAQNDIASSFNELKAAADYTTDPDITNDPTTCSTYMAAHPGGYCYSYKSPATSVINLGNDSDPCNVEAYDQVSDYQYQYDGTPMPPEYTALDCDNLWPPECDDIYYTWSAAHEKTTTALKQYTAINGKPKENEIVALKGSQYYWQPTIVQGGGSHPERGTVCAKNLFITGGAVTMGGSIRKADGFNADTQSNVVIMSGGNISINGNTRLADGQTLYNHRWTQTGFNNTGPTGDVSLHIDASLIPAGLQSDGSPSNFAIDPYPTFYAQKSSEALNFKNLELNGMVVTGETTSSGKTFQGGAVIDGFEKVVMTTPDLSDPPPGLKIKSDIAIAATLTGRSFSRIDMNEAIATVEKD